MDWKRISRPARAAALLAVFVFVVLLITTVFGKKGLIEIYKSRQTYAGLQKEIQRLKEEKSRLEREIAALEADPRSVEREARDRLWLVKPDEKIVVKKKK
jgi:cell division protein FtsB